MNRVLLVGRLTAEPVLKYSSSTPLCNFILAVDREPQECTITEKTDFINCVCWNGLAESLEAHNGKGNLISVDGKVRKRSYEDGKGNLCYIMEIYCESIRFLEPNRKKVKQ